MPQLLESRSTAVRSHHKLSTSGETVLRNSTKAAARIPTPPLKYGESFSQKDHGESILWPRERLTQPIVRSLAAISITGQASTTVIPSRSAEVDASSAGKWNCAK